MLTTSNQGAKYDYIWAASNLVCGAFFYFCLPELKGRTLEEIDELFERNILARQFKSTKTNIVDEAMKEVEAKEAALVDATWLSRWGQLSRS